MDTEFLRPTVPILQGPRERIFLTNRFKYKSHLRVGIRGIEESEIRSLRLDIILKVSHNAIEIGIR